MVKIKKSVPENGGCTKETTENSNLVDALDSILDTELEGSTRGLGQASELSEKFKLFIPLSLLQVGDKFHIRYHISRQNSESREIRLFLETVKAKLIDGNWVSIVLDSDISSTWKTSLREFSKIKATSILLSYVEGGIVKFRVRFHHSTLGIISDLILNTKQGSQSMDINYLGRSHGAKRLLGEIAEKIPLKSIRFFSEIPSRNNLPDGKWIREVNSSTSNKRVHAIYEFEKEMEESENLVHISGRIYEGITEEGIHTFFNSRATELGVIRLSRVQRRTAKGLETEVILPAIYSGTYLSILSEANMKFPDWNLKLLEVSDVIPQRPTE